MSAGRWGALSPRKQDRFTFVKFTCEQCGERQTQTVRTYAATVVCIECRGVRRIKDGERSDKP